MDKKFDEYQLEEYKNISNAHFETNKQIGIFFRDCWMMASAPAGIVIGDGNDKNFMNLLIRTSLPKITS